MSLRQDLLSALQSYETTWCLPMASYQLRDTAFDKSAVALFKDFVERNAKCFDRSNMPGHITGSALVLNQDLSKVLLTHHKKLGMWLQLGGHADGHHIAHEVAMTEALEESGLKGLEFLSYERDIFGTTKAFPPIPFDLDRHLIPANHRDAEHYHYDVRYLLISTTPDAPIVSDESHDVGWFTFEQARKLTSEASMIRQFSKVEWIKKSLKL